MVVNNKIKKQFLTGLAVAIVAPLIVEHIRKQLKKKEAAKKPYIEANTDHGFSSWVGDDNFFEIEGDRNVATNPHMSLVPLTSRERMMRYPEFKKYQPFNVTPAKKIKIV